MVVLHLVYLSSRKHFDYLFLSLKSWLLVSDLHFVKSISIYVDCNDSFTELQICLLQKCSFVSLDFFSTQRPIKHYGIDLVMDELHAFNRLAQVAHSEDWIVKIDSDVLMTKSVCVFNYLIQSSSSMIGNPFDDYIQGGIYFLRAKEIYRMSPFDIGTNRYISDVEHCAEDAVISEQMRKGGGIIEQIDIVWNQPPLEKLKLEPTAYTFLHFSMHTKTYMEQAFSILSE